MTHTRRALCLLPLLLLLACRGATPAPEPVAEEPPAAPPAPDFQAFFRAFQAAVQAGDQELALAHVDLPLTQRLQVIVTPSTLGEPQLKTFSREKLVETQDYWRGMDAEVLERPDDSKVEQHPRWQLLLGDRLYTGAGVGKGEFTVEDRGNHVAASLGSWQPAEQFADTQNQSTLLFAVHDGIWKLEEIYLVRYFP